METDLSELTLQRGDLVVSAHACGNLTDQILATGHGRVRQWRRFPIADDLRTADLGGLEGWMDGPLAIDAVRVARLYFPRLRRVNTQLIPGDITPKNRLLIAEPED